ncbi:hypothetical protein Ais01nite_14640 [Asanoa ishikariensis]|uniref:PH domain-containing protein n=1 Tax=Asanoa ishikariensis TaxID=137265 RepID=A0A1H3UIB9_9ACTN|nr:PH domain-containing protein [Asanoa ishikariensis]GIF63429.1 hypothetical protein Ais01nite_14640 [Asanoa ishikariensis]SDZ62232.1 PH domain-containing protein [Asanoa ishikariensis]
MPRWERVEGDSGNVRYVVAAAFSVGGLVPLCGLAATEARQSAPLVLPFLLVWYTLVWRIALAGVCVGADGIKIRSVLRTRIVPWGRVARVWACPATGHDAWQLWVTTRDPDRDLPTPIWRLSPAIKRRGAGRTPERVILSPDRFSVVLTTLRSRTS